MTFRKLLPVRITSLIPALLVLLLIGCSDDNDPIAPVPPETIEPATAQLVASKLSVLAVAVAAVPEGQGIFDNFLACPRRGVVDFRNTSAGRQATFSGCDLGDGVTVDGTAEIRFTAGAPQARCTFSELELVGDVDVRIEGGETVEVERMSVDGISFSRTTFCTIRDLDRSGLGVTLFDESYSVDERGSPDRLFFPSLTISSIPNPSGTLDALTDTDIKFIAFHLGARLAQVLAINTEDPPASEQTNTIGQCGSTRVIPNQPGGLVRLENSWDGTENGCLVSGGGSVGVLVAGDFSQEWAEYDPAAGELAMVVEGPFTVGGGLPRTTLTRLEWRASGTNSLPGQVRISGTIVGESQTRTFSFDLQLDD